MTFFLQVFIAPCVCSTLRSLMKALGSLELELQTIMRHHMGTVLKHSGRTINALHCGVISLALTYFNA